MNRKGLVFLKNSYCGLISETDSGYSFQYDLHFLKKSDAHEVSPTLPLTENIFYSKTLFAFFDGLIPEGWLLNLAEKNWKINYKDRMGLLLMCCKDAIGAVSVENSNEKL
jgi:serine/threonine-protein kinase HipA